MKHLDLFSGIGGFALAARMVGGIETCQFVEIDPYCQKVLTKNFTGIPVHGDIRTFATKPGAYDIITGGFPCQDNSLANQNGRGLAGERSSLWFEMRRVIAASQPRYVVVENVPPSRNRRWDITVRSNLEALGYTIAALRLSAKSVGANHLRKRLFLVAYADSNRRISAENFYRLTREVPHQEKSTWWQNGGEFRRGNSGRVFLLPRSWAGRVDDGFPSKLDIDRLKGLGNAVLPHVAAIVLQRVKALEVTR